MPVHLLPATSRTRSPMTTAPASTSYRSLFETPSQVIFFFATFLGRVPISMKALGAILLIQQTTGSYSLAGLVLSIGLMLAGIRLPDKALRLAGLLLLTATILKVFLIDAAALEGVDVPLADLRAGEVADPVVQGALRVSAGLGSMVETWSRAPGQVLARLHLLAAADAANACGMRTWALCGRAGSPLAERCDDAICVDSPHTATVQEVHLIAIHLLCAAVEQALERTSVAPMEQIA